MSVLTRTNSRSWLLRLVLALVLCGLVACDEVRSESFRDFSGGLNTATNWTMVKPNQFQQVLNWVLDDPVGALTIRPGFRKVGDTLLSYQKEYLSLHSHKFETGQVFLDAVVQLKDSGWARLYRSPANSYHARDSVLATKLYPNRGWWCSFNGADYFWNGRNRPLVITNQKGKNECAPVNMVAPGQPEVKPIAVTGNLNGVYQYAILGEVPCSLLVSANPKWSMRPSTLSLPVLATNEKVEISNFLPISNDSGCPAPADTVHEWFKILRTRANRSDYDTDSLFVIDSFHITRSTVAAKLYRDTLADSSLHAVRYWGRIGKTPLAFDTLTSYSWAHRWLYQALLDPKRHNSYSAGQISLLASDTGNAHHKDTVFGSGYIDHDRAMLYSYYLWDSRTGIQSDTAPATFLWSTTGKKNFTISVPPPPSRRYYRVLVRANIADRAFYSDTTKAQWSITLDQKTNQFVLRPKAVGSYLFSWIKEWDAIPLYILDTLRDSAQSIYWDTLGPFGVETYKPIYDRRVPLTNYKGAIVHDGRLFAWDGNTVYVSTSDTADFPFFNQFDLGPDDGDYITGLASFEGFVLVYKSNSTWVLYTKDGQVYDQRKASKGFGAVSPQAIASYAATQIVLGPRGVAQESGNPYRDNDIAHQFISDPIKNLIVRPAIQMAQATAATIADKVLISYPGTDSLFVLFAKTGGWGIWGFDFSASTPYDTSATPGTAAFDQLVFARPNDNQLYVLDDTATTDASTAYSAVWQKNNLSDNELEQTVNELRMLTTSNVSDTVKAAVLITNELGDTLIQTSIGQLARQFHRKRLAAQKNRVGHSFNLRITLPSTGRVTINDITLQSSAGSGTD